MKAITNLVKGMMIVMVSLLIFSCSDGEDGAIGPAGQNGIDGIDGTNGTDGNDGADGVDGPPGTANVIYSDWIPADFPGGIDSDKSMLLLSSLTAFDKDTDAILVYGRNPANALFFNVYELPYFNVDNEEFYGIEMGEGTGFESLRVRGQTTDGLLKAFSFFDDFRYVIIPGGVSTNPTSSATKSSIDYSSMSYEEVKTLFNIPE
ncbi:MULTISPECIES: collagen-like protein [Aquimarina]|uniref:Collagen-like protein n=1 Tax=Aquimarina algiphila TaxID=2047982 RepID=A0A554VMA1_9FLAO|nr:MULTISPECIES: collagen-like protein [Aquimarina]TSE09369.1 collagen-like protein [Aquimarina algiphila]